MELLHGGMSSHDHISNTNSTYHYVMGPQQGLTPQHVYLYVCHVFNVVITPTSLPVDVHPSVVTVVIIGALTVVFPFVSLTPFARYRCVRVAC